VLWSHNDSGGAARVFALSLEGAELAQTTLTGTLANDWEDLALGPCGSADCLFVGDVGDNRRRRSDYSLRRFVEPDDPSAGGAAQADWLAFTYPAQESRNCEALLVHPGDGQVTLVSKVDEGPSEVFELPHPWIPGSTVEAALAGTVQVAADSEQVTGGDVHPAAKGVLLRTYSDLLYYPMGADQTVAQALTQATTACRMPVADEDQGEAVAFLPAGGGYLTVGEGAEVGIYQVDCEDF